jgi:hypothetical protein
VQNCPTYLYFGDIKPLASAKLTSSPRCIPDQHTLQTMLHCRIDGCTLNALRAAGNPYLLGGASPLSPQKSGRPRSLQRWGLVLEKSLYVEADLCP